MISKELSGFSIGVSGMQRLSSVGCSGCSFAHSFWLQKGVFRCVQFFFTVYELNRHSYETEIL